MGHAYSVNATVGHWDISIGFTGFSVTYNFRRWTPPGRHHQGSTSEFLTFNSLEDALASANVSPQDKDLIQQKYIPALVQFNLKFNALKQKRGALSQYKALVAEYETKFPGQIAKVQWPAENSN